MKMWKLIAALPIIALGSQALAANWVTVATRQLKTGAYDIKLDKDSIRRDADGLVHFSKEDGVRSHEAVNCKTAQVYLLSIDDIEQSYPNWRKHPDPIEGPIEQAELNYACANAK